MGLDNSKRNLLMKHFEQLHDTFSGLKPKEAGNGRFVITGNLGFTVSHDDKTIRDDTMLRLQYLTTILKIPPQ